MTLKRDEVPRHERLELIRQLILKGITVRAITRDFERGTTLKDGRKVKCSRQQLGRDIRQIGSEWQASHDDPAELEARAGAALERLEGLAVAAATRQRAVRRTITRADGSKETVIEMVPDPNYHAAIQANVQIVRVIGILTPRWRAGMADLTAGEPVATDDLDDLTDAELLARHAQSRERVARLTLVPDLDDAPLEGEAEDLARRSG